MKKMLNIVVVEDDKDEREALCGILRRFSDEEQEPVNITEYGNALNFLEDHKQSPDIVFLDIQMPFMDGMEAARRFREFNTEAIIIFITGMVQYAVQGYEVNALDFIVKPVSYYSFLLKMRRAVKQIYSKEQKQFIIQTGSGMVKTAIRDIRYVEVSGHKLIYHLRDRDVVTYSTLREVSEKLGQSGFAFCNSCYLVNLYYVTGVQNYTVMLGETMLQISRPKKKAFLKALNEYVG